MPVCAELAPSALAGRDAGVVATPHRVARTSTESAASRMARVTLDGYRYGAGCSTAFGGPVRTPRREKLDHVS